MKHILYLLPQPFFLTRGSSFRALATIKAVLKLFCFIDILCYPMGAMPVELERDPRCRAYRSKSIFHVNSVKVGPSFKKIYLDWFFYNKARELVSNNNYSLIHGVEEAGLMAHRLSKQNNIPYIYDMHSWMSQQIEEGGFCFSNALLEKFKHMEKAAYKDAAAIITVGEVMAEILNGDFSKQKAYVLNDYPLSTDKEPEYEICQQIINDYFSDDIKVILYTGNFHKYQGIDLLLDAVAELKQKLSSEQKFKLLLVGGLAGDNKNVNFYREKVQKLDLTEKVIFCGEYPLETMSVFMSNADILVSSRSQGNNVPLKIYNYLTSGTLLVATNINSHTQVLNDNNSVLTDPNPEAFAEALKYSLFEISDDQKKEIIAQAGAIRPEDRIRQFEDVIAKIYADLGVVGGGTRPLT